MHSISPLLLRINGLPAHPLVVHGAVVFIPLAALGALAYLVPRWRDYLRWPLLVTLVLAVAFVWGAFLTGGNFRDSAAYFHQGALGAQLDKHETDANILAWVTTAFTVVTAAAIVWMHARTGGLRVLASGVIGVLAVVTLVFVFLTGEAGAKAVYPPSASSVSSVSPVSPVSPVLSSR